MLRRFTLGVDLAADPKNTALVKIDWHASAPRLVHLLGEGRKPVSEEDILAAMASMTPDADEVRAGMDCPLGWPKAFVKLMGDDAAGGVGTSSFATPESRQALAYRETDRHVRAVTKAHTGTAVHPLSVSADRIAHVAFRMAGIRSQLPGGAWRLRDGTGPLIEVYPAAALALWGCDHQKYKGVDPKARAAREVIVDRLTGMFGVSLGSHRQLMIDSDHVLDAFVCALVARDAELYPPEPVPEELGAQRNLEGWIHLPVPQPAW